MTGNAWLAARVALALGLMAAFYALALSIGLGLLWIAYADVFLTGTRVHPKLVLFCAFAGGSVLWAIVPRPDRFQPPGPRVMPAHEPELFKVLREVAGATNQDMPAEVYVVNDVNAFVTQRGGLMGFGSRRVMGLGLPLMQALSVQEFRGVVAHEFGHYHSGDVGLGPWIYKTRAAIGRTIEQLSSSVLQKIFVWYGNLFLRITHAISRRQEFIADEVAARTAGGGAMISGLRRVHAAALAFQGYWHTELGPILSQGYLPPVSQGFHRFMQTPHVASRLSAAVTHEEAEGRTDPFDTHPSLKERVAALSSLPQGSPGDTRPASSLLSNIATWERRVLGTIVSDDWARALKAVEWDKVAETVFVPIWRDRVKRHTAVLQKLTPATIPTTRRDLARLGGALVGTDEGDLPEDVRVMRMMQLLMSAIGLQLLALGWNPSTAPGDEIVLSRGGEELRLYTELLAVVDGKTTTDRWRERCAALGIADVSLTGALAPM